MTNYFAHFYAISFAQRTIKVFIWKDRMFLSQDAMLLTVYFALDVTHFTLFSLKLIKDKIPSGPFSNFFQIFASDIFRFIVNYDFTQQNHTLKAKIISYRIIYRIYIL